MFRAMVLKRVLDEVQRLENAMKTQCLKKGWKNWREVSRLAW